MILPILYSFRRCPYAMRARLVLLNRGVNCVVREVRLSNKPPELAMASPKATVPVLILSDHSVIDESIDIMMWALNQNCHPERVAGSYFTTLHESKMPKHVQHDGLNLDQSALIVQNDGAFKHHLDRYKYPEKYSCDATEHRVAGTAILHGYETRLSQTRFLLGPEPCLADYALLPFIRQFAHVDREYFYAQPLPHLIEWLTSHLEGALFKSAMQHFPIWKSGDEDVFLI